MITSLEKELLLDVYKEAECPRWNHEVELFKEEIETAKQLSRKGLVDLSRHGELTLIQLTENGQKIIEAIQLAEELIKE